MENMENKTFFRYRIVEYGYTDINGELISPSIPNPTIILDEYNLIKETPKGYWIGYGEYGNPNVFQSLNKWVSKTSKKRYAYPTKEDALNNFIKRNERRIKILQRQLTCCQIAVDIAKSMNI